jgi:hypothetical protein
MKTVTCTFNPLTHKVVQIESTTKMDQAGEKVLENSGEREEAAPCWDAMIAAAPEYPSDAGWISVDERLPDIHTHVTLTNVGKWMNTGGDFEVNWYGHGWICEFGHKFWSVIGESGAMTLDSVTHWMPLPSVPEGV